MFGLFRRKTSIADSGLLQGMTDYHSHLLPGVDDGVQTLSETLEILQEMERQGVTDVWFTPHIMEDIPNETADLRKKFEETREAYLETGGKVSLHLAAENMLDNLFEERFEKDDLLPIDEDGKRYLLVETSYFNPPMGFHDILKRIRQRGYYPLLAHPERYGYMSMDDYEELKSAGVLFQLNIPALGGMYGGRVRDKAEKLMKNGMYDFMGSDIHSRRYLIYMLDSDVSALR